MLVKAGENRLNLGRVSIEALNKPVGWEEFDGQQEFSIGRIKTASIDKTQDLGGFDLTEAVKEHPDHLFVKVFAIKKDEVNDNGDSFSEEELKKAAHTFIGVPVFTNHQNDDIEKAKGKVVHAWYDEDRGGIYIISMIDKVAYPKLARGIEEGYISGTSMGCQVAYSLCSICHNKAHVADEYCDHVKHRKTKKFSGKAKCAYHKSKCKPKDACPECGCMPDEEKEHTYKDAQIHEKNKELKFIEDSLVVNPACHECLVQCVLNVPEYTKKVANVQVKLEKVMKAVGPERLIKVAGQKEIEYLNKAMRMMEVVAKSMMDQKESVSMEYVSDIIDVLASLQTATDELVEMGYGSLQSPQSLENPEEVGDAVPTGNAQPQQQQPSQMPAPATPTGAASAPVEGLGSVTKPTFSPSAAGKMKELLKEGSKLREKIASLSEIASKVNGAVESDLETAAQLITEIADEANLPRLNKESGNNMSNTEKTAAGVGTTPEQQQVTTQKQLEEWSKKDVLHGRTDKAPEGVTESDQQLGGKEQLKDVKSATPQVRENTYPEETTQGQFDKNVFSGNFVERWSSYPEVITEKTWRDFDRAVGAVLTTDQKEHTTQAQLEDLRSHHRWTEPDYTTENQLASDNNWKNPDAAWLNKSAASDYSKALVTAAIESLSDAIAYYKRTPSELTKAAAFMTKDPMSHMKAAFITLVNGMPGKKEARRAEIERNFYFKQASTNVDAVDSLLACMGDHCMNLKAEDFVDAVRYVASDKSRMAAVEAKAQEKTASFGTTKSEQVIDKFAEFDKAFGDITNADGLFEVCAMVSEIETDVDAEGLPKNAEAFVEKAEKFAKAQLATKQAGVDTVLFSVDVDPASKTETGEIIPSKAFIQLKEACKLSCDEKTAVEEKKKGKKAPFGGKAAPLFEKKDKRAEARAELVKEAQMMGGEMGGQGGAAGAPGAGSSLPTPPAGGAGPQAPQTPPMESLQDQEGAEMGGPEGGDQEPKPPGSICPVCGSEDVDIVEGKGKCNNCNSQFVFKVQVEVTRWTGVNDKNSDEEGGEGGPEAAPDLAGGEGGSEGEGFPMPEGDGQTPNIPVAAMTKLPFDVITKLASSETQIGAISPLTGSKNTMHIGGSKFMCLDTGKTYEVHIAVSKDDPKAGMWVEWRWTPVYKGADCPTCKKAKQAWSSALKQYGISDKDFDTMSFKKKADTILDMHTKGMFKTIKTASKNSSVVAEFKTAYTVHDKFPVESCREKLARRYGENAVAMSGPCKGEKIYDCVCDQLKQAGVYSDRIAVKLADTWQDKDACVECMEDYVRIGYDLEKAATVCQYLKLKYAGPEEMFGEELTDSQPDMGGGDVGMEGDIGGDVASDPGLEEVDPFSDGAGAGDENLPAPAGDVAPEGEVPADGGPSAQIDGNELEIESPVGDVGLPGGDAGAGQQTVTIEIPVDAVKQMVLDKLAPGAAGASPELPATAGPVPVDMPKGLGDEIADVAETATQALQPELGEPDADNAGGPPDGDADDNGESTDGGDKGPDDDKPKGGGFPGSEGEDTGDSDNKEPNVDTNEIKEGNDSPEQMEADHFASIMRKGKRVGQIDMDLSSVKALLQKKAINEGVTPTVEKAQDVVDKFKDGKTIGQEQKFDAGKPSVPRATATLGAEEADRNPKDKPLPKVPSSPAEASIGHEKELGYTSQAPNMTGGTVGAGKTETASSDKQTKVAEQTKTAGEKKIAPKKPDSEQTEVTFSNNKDHSKTPEHLKRTPFEGEKTEPKIPEKGEGAFIGKEKESIGEIPKAPEMQPSIPAGGGRNPKYDKNEKNEPEMLDQIKGTVIAKNDEGSKEVRAEAFRIAGRMLEAKMIEAAQLMEQVTKLAKYEMPELKLLESTIFKTASTKGLAAEPDGVEGSPVVISADSSIKSAQGKADLKSQLQQLFRLDQQNKIASELTDADLRKQYGK